MIYIQLISSIDGKTIEKILEDRWKLVEYLDSLKGSGYIIASIGTKGKEVTGEASVLDLIDYVGEEL